MNRNGIWLLIVAFAVVTCLPVTISWAADEQEITVVGVLVKLKRKDYLTTDDGQYMVIGQDFSRLIGRKIRATGKVMENSRGKTMLVRVMEIVTN